MKQYRVLIVDDAIQKRFEEQILAIACRIKALASQNSKLIEARNYLLPKMMCGENEV